LSWNDVATTDPVRVVINVAEQRAYVYRGEALVAATTVSTGKSGKDTPSGTFTILQKKIDHRSNLYDDAPMPSCSG
jgi:lipoprotein-anchoring transpeptidase ErfK/SrfK